MGETFKVADVMTLFPFKEMQAMSSLGLENHPALGAYLERLAERSAFRRAMEKAEPGAAKLPG